MWTRLTDERLDARLESSLRASKNDYSAVQALVTELRGKPFADLLYLVVGMGGLSLHYAPYAEDQLRLAHIRLALTSSQASIGYFPRDARQADDERSCKPDELIGLVEVYALRLLHEAGLA